MGDLRRWRAASRSPVITPNRVYLLPGLVSVRRGHSFLRIAPTGSSVRGLRLASLPLTPATCEDTEGPCHRPRGLRGGGIAAPLSAQLAPSPAPRGRRCSNGLAGAGAARRDAESGCRVRTRGGLSLLSTRSLGMRCHFDGICFWSHFMAGGNLIQ